MCLVDSDVAAELVEVVGVLRNLGYLSVAMAGRHLRLLVYSLRPAYFGEVLNHDLLGRVFS